MCKSHNKVFGKEAVELFAEARQLNNVCQARLTYLKRQAKSFHDWLRDEMQVAEATEICMAIVNSTLRSLKEQGPDSLTNRPDDELNPTLWDIHHEMGDLTIRMDDEEACYLDYQKELENIANSSMGDVDAKLHWYNSKLYTLNNELMLHDKIQDAIDVIPEFDVYTKLSYKNREAWRLYRIKCFTRIDELRKARKLSYDGWFIFNNQLLEKIGRDPAEYRYGEMHLLADKIIHYENLKQAAKDKIESDKEIVQQEQLPPENYVALYDEAFAE